MKKPLCIELYAGMSTWAAGWRDLGGHSIGFDIEHLPHHGPIPPSCEVVLQDVLTLHGRQFRNADLILASPPCQAYSYRAMPWKRAKALPPPSNELFDACFRIQREASEAAGRYIPMVVENVCGAQRWVGRAAWHYGSFYLWGDVPALMPTRLSLKNTGGSWFGERDGKPLELNDPRDMLNNKTGDFEPVFGGNNHPGKQLDGLKRPGRTISEGFNNWPKDANGDYIVPGTNQGGEWWHDPASMTRKYSSRSSARKAASAMIARIPYDLSLWIAQVYWPDWARSSAADQVQPHAACGPPRHDGPPQHAPA